MSDYRESLDYLYGRLDYERLGMPRSAADLLIGRMRRILRALGEGLEGKFNERLDKAIELDSSFQHQMPLLAKGRYYFELPWPKRNLGKSAGFYRRALAAEPGNLRGMAWLAETLWRDGDVAGARAQIARVQDGRLPDDPAEEARAKSIARKVAAQMEKEGAK